MPHRTFFARIFPVLSLLIAAAVASAAPASGPTTLPASRPTTVPTAPDKQKEKKVSELTKKAIQLMEKSKLTEAEDVLMEALKLDPTHTTNLYNFACCMAREGKSDKAVIFLEKAAENGWSDFIYLSRDPDLKSIRDLPGYKAFVAKKAEYQKRAAQKALASLKAQFGDSYLYDLDEERKLIFATNTDKETLAELKRLLQMQAASEWAELFTSRPDEFISIVLPSPADYRKIVRMPGVGGFYADDAKLLIAQHLGQTIQHEFTHALHAGDRAPLGQDHPIWIAEGLASMYEAARWEGDRLVPQDNFRLNILQNAAKRKALIPLKTLTEMKQSQFVAKANFAYGQASSVMLYLYEHGLLKKWYEAYKAGFDADPTGRTAIEKVTGTSFDQFEKDWIDWMTARKPVPMNTGSDGVTIGIAMDDGNDGIVVKEVLPGSPASQAGVHRGDVLVGVSDIEVRDSQSLFPVLMQFKAGDKVTLKLRREGKYLELPIVLARRSQVLNNVVGRTTTRPSSR